MRPVTILVALVLVLAGAGMATAGTYGSYSGILNWDANPATANDSLYVQGPGWPSSTAWAKWEFSGQDAATAGQPIVWTYRYTFVTHSPQGGLSNFLIQASDSLSSVSNLRFSTLNNADVVFYGDSILQASNSTNPLLNSLLAATPSPSWSLGDYNILGEGNGVRDYHAVKLNAGDNFGSDKYAIMVQFETTRQPAWGGISASDGNAGEGTSSVKNAGWNSGIDGEVVASDNVTGGLNFILTGHSNMVVVPDSSSLPTPLPALIVPEPSELIRIFGLAAMGLVFAGWRWKRA
jgi:hypothetical protein